MKPLLLSCALILVVSELALSDPSLNANGSPSADPVKPNPTSVGASKKPSPRLTINRQQQKSHTAQTDQQTQPDPQGTDKNPFVIKSLEAEKTTERREQDRTEREEKSANEGSLITWTITLAITTIVLALIAGGQLYMFSKQLGFISQNLAETTKAADAALKEAESTRVAERAYVKMSHFPPGIIFVPGLGPAISIRVENFGRTPARVTDIVISFKNFPNRADVPKEPDYSGARPVSQQGFLVTGDSFQIFRNSPFSSEDGDRFIAGKEQLFVWGYVDYIDQFGKPHRAGYGRRFNPIMEMRQTYANDENYRMRSNLDLITELGYNYDRPRTREESKEWDEPL